MIIGKKTELRKKKIVQQNSIFKNPQEYFNLFQTSNTKLQAIKENSQEHQNNNIIKHFSKIKYEEM